MTTGFVTDDGHTAHRLDGHPERPERLTAIIEHLERTGLRSRMTELTPRDATDEEIVRVHPREVIALQERLAAAGGGRLDQDTYVTPSSPAIARRAAGSTLVALEAVLNGYVDNAFAAVRPPGHHAVARNGLRQPSGAIDHVGFCLLNNLAIAAQAALAGGLERIAIVDWDVHHGNGTQAIFDADPRVLYFSTHASPLYPGSGAVEDCGTGQARGTMVHVPLPPGVGDAEFVQAYERVGVPALERFRPQLVLVSCGWDAHARDPLGPLAVTTDGYTRVARLVRDAAASLCDGRLVVTLEGGYDTHVLAWCAGALCELLLGEEPTPDPQPVDPPPGPDVSDVIAAARRVARIEG